MTTKRYGTTPARWMLLLAATVVATSIVVAVIGVLLER
jgi:hypothetical protein